MKISPNFSDNSIKNENFKRTIQFSLLGEKNTCDYRVIEGKKKNSSKVEENRIIIYQPRKPVRQLFKEKSPNHVGRIK